MLIDQYDKLKKNFPDTIIFIEHNDYVETFRDDAVKVSITLGTVLINTTDGIALTGFDKCNLDLNTRKLVKAGYRVGTCYLLNKTENNGQSKPKESLK